MNHEKIFARICDDLSRMPAWQRNAVAEDAGVAPITVYFWISGRSASPMARTLFAVAEALGYELTLKQRRRIRAA